MGNLNDEMMEALGNAGYTGALSDRLASFMRDYGITGNDSWYQFLYDRGYTTGSLNDKQINYFANGIAAFVGPTAKVVTLGDSIMAGSSSGGQVWEGIHEQIPGGGTYYNKAVGGRTLVTILAEAADDIANHAGEGLTGVIINGGINDIAALEPPFATIPFPSTLVDDMLADAQAIVATAAPLQCMFIGLLPRQQAGSWCGEEQVVCDEFNARMAIWCNENNVLFVDAQTPLLDPAYPEQDRKLADYNGTTSGNPDYTHLSVAGAQAIGDAIEAVATSRAKNADALVASEVLARYSNLTAKEEAAIASFVYRQSRLGNWNNIIDIALYALSDETDALTTMKGVVSPTLAKTTGFATFPTHSPGEGFAFTVTGSTAGSYIALNASPATLNPNYATEGWGIGGMIGATPATVDNQGNVLLGSVNAAACFTNIGYNRVGTDRFNATLDSFNTTNAIPTTVVPAAGALYLARRQGAWDAAYNVDFWSAAEGLYTEAEGNGGIATYNAINMSVNGYINPSNVMVGMWAHTAAMTVLVKDQANLAQLAPQAITTSTSTAKPAGADILFANLS